MKRRYFIVLFLIGVLVSIGIWRYQSQILEANRDQPIGNRKIEVAEIQIALRAKGFAVPITGTYGPETAEAVAAIQAEEGLLVDGIVGPQTMKALEKQMAALPTGQTYHNVPAQMRLGKEETIEAGTAPQITDQIKATIQGKGEVVTQTGVPFNPAGFEMKLIVNEDEFKVLKVQGGRQSVTHEHPGKWTWEIRPLKSGRHKILIFAETDRPPSPEISEATSNPPPPIPIRVFDDYTEIKGNLLYSTQELVKKDWVSLLALVCGSGVAGWLAVKTRRYLIALFLRGWQTVIFHLQRFY